MLKNNYYRKMPNKSMSFNLTSFDKLAAWIYQVEVRVSTEPKVTYLTPHQPAYT